LGGADQQGGDFNPTNYQAQIVGATDGYLPTGWFNTSTMRGIGWHHARIVVLSARPDKTSGASFYIDDMANPTLIHDTGSTNGFNSIALNARFGNRSAYYDDITFDVAPAPVLNAAATGTNF